jgi:hypothetical protein
VRLPVPSAGRLAPGKGPSSSASQLTGPSSELGGVCHHAGTGKPRHAVGAALAQYLGCTVGVTPSYSRASAGRVSAPSADAMA